MVLLFFEARSFVESSFNPLSRAVAGTSTFAPIGFAFSLPYLILEHETLGVPVKTQRLYSLWLIESALSNHYVPPSRGESDPQPRL